MGAARTPGPLIDLSPAGRSPRPSQCCRMAGDRKGNEPDAAEREAKDDRTRGGSTAAAYLAAVHGSAIGRAAPLGELTAFAHVANVARPWRPSVSASDASGRPSN